MAINLLLVVLGAAILLGGGEVLVRGAVALARSLGVSTMIVGLTVVAYGTSAPELAVSVMAASSGKPAICSGNVVGSNILNILLVLGTTAAIFPLQATAAFLRREVPIMVGISVLFFVLAWNGILSRAEAVILLVALVSYTLLAIQIARREKGEVVRKYEEHQTSVSRRSVALNLVLIAVGLAMLTGGSHLFLGGAVGVARWLGVSDAIIGLTLVALGTSLPELAACLIAAYRKQADICLGNIVGSCIYNIAAIAGLSAVVAPLPFEREMIHVHIPIMVGAAVVLWPMLLGGSRLSRLEGVLLLGFYIGYMGWMVAGHV